MKLLVVAAWEPELSPVRKLVASRLRDVNIAFGTLGVGIVEAAIGATRLVSREEPAFAVFVGTCGVFSAALSDVPEVVSGLAVDLVSASVLSGSAEIPGPMPTRVPLDASFHDAVVRAGARSVQIANTVGVTVDDRLASQFGEVAGAEHLEAFAFARVAQTFDVPCGVVLGAANAVGSMGRAQWRARHDEASARAAEVAVSALEDYLRTTTRLPSPEPG